MKSVRLANILDLKYGLMSEASDLTQIIDGIKKNIINAYDLYVSRKSKDPVLQILADIKEPFSKSFISVMEKTIENIDVLAITPHLLFRQLNKMLGMIKDAKSDNKVRSFIHEKVRITKESDKNYREQLKSKFELVLHRLSSILEKQAKILNAFLAINWFESPLAGGLVDRERKQLSKEKLLMFSHTAAAEKYGFDSLYVLTKLLQSTNTREALTTLVNAIDRGQIPSDGVEIMEKTKAIKEMFDLLNATNEDFFEKSEEEAVEELGKLSPEVEWAQQMHQSKKQKALELQDEEIAKLERERLDPLVKKRDEEAKLKEIEKDRERHIRSEGSLNLNRLSKR